MAYKYYQNKIYLLLSNWKNTRSLKIPVHNPSYIVRYCPREMFVFSRNSVIKLYRRYVFLEILMQVLNMHSHQQK